MKKPLLYQLSPFLFVQKKADSIILNNLLINKKTTVNPELLENLKRFRHPCKYPEIAAVFGEAELDSMISEHIFMESENIWRTTDIEAVEIEISTHCNWRCEYCPERFDPKEKEFMSMELFQEIIDKAARHDTVKFISVNSFNEPLLDIHFEERIKILSETNLQLILHTNGSALTKEKIKFLKDSGVVSVIYFNLPSLNEENFKIITGSDTFKKTLENIDNTIEAGLNVEFSVQRVNMDDEVNLKNMNDRFAEAIGKPVELWNTCDRAGLVTEKYFQNVNLYGKLLGCIWPLRWMFIGVDGSCFLCHHDYYQKEVYGNIKDGEIKEVLNTQAAQIMRKNVFGNVVAKDDFICRKCHDMLEFSEKNVPLIKES